MIRLLRLLARRRARRRDRSNSRSSRRSSPLMTIGVVDISNAFGRKLTLEQAAQRAIEKIMQTTGVHDRRGDDQERSGVPGQRPTRTRPARPPDHDRQRRRTDGSNATASRPSSTRLREPDEARGALTSQVTVRRSMSRCSRSTSRRSNGRQDVSHQRDGRDADPMKRLLASSPRTSAASPPSRWHSPCRSLIIMMWMIVQLGLVFRAMSGHPAGTGRGRAPRHAVSAVRPIDAIHGSRPERRVYGIGPGTFTIDDSGQRVPRTSQLSRPQGQLHAANQPAARSRARRSRSAAPSGCGSRLSSKPARRPLRPRREEGGDGLRTSSDVSRSAKWPFSSSIRSSISSCRPAAQQPLGQAQRLGGLGEQGRDHAWRARRRARLSRRHG